MSKDIPSDSIVVKLARLAVASELKKKRILKQPIAKFDPKAGKVYLLHGDGTRQEFGRVSGTRYSERHC